MSFRSKAFLNSSVNLFSGFKLLKKSFSGTVDTDKIIQVLNSKIIEYKRYLKRNSRSTYLGRKTASSIDSLTIEVANLRKSKMSASNAGPLIPCCVSLEVVSNGSSHLQPCVVLHTNFKDYLFNCPEGTSRFLAANRLKAQHLNDIFFTRDTWDNFAGVSSILKTPYSSLANNGASPIIRLHGSHNKSKYFEHQNEHADADFPSSMAAKIEEHSLNAAAFSDDAISVHYIPVTSLSTEHRSDQSKKLGKLYLTSCIEKDACRLTLNIIKVEDLPKGGITGPPDVCVRVHLTQGNIAQTKQSRVIKNTCSAVYKEAIMFLIKTSLAYLQDTSITISVHDLSRTTTGDDLIGSAFLGKLAIDKSEIDQWKSTIDHQGKEYKAVHHLKAPCKAPDVHVAETLSDSE